MKQIREEIQVLQDRLEDGDVITIRKSDFQIALDRRMPTNVEHPFMLDNTSEFSFASQ